MMHFNAKETTIQKNNLKIVKFVDGDGIILEDIISKKEFEVRFYGIDAPEINYCNKIKKMKKNFKFQLHY
jgi:micrococcal nuclease